MVSPKGMSWPRKINGLQLQTSLSAPTEAKGFSGALTNLGHNQPHKQTPPKASSSEGVLERNLSAARGVRHEFALSRKASTRRVSKCSWFLAERLRWELSVFALRRR